MLDKTNGKRVVQQLRELHVREFLLLDSLSCRARVKPCGQGNFQIILRSDRAAHWSVDVGHELGHILLGMDSADRNKGREEELCEYFGFCWAVDENNCRETTHLLQPLLDEAAERCIPEEDEKERRKIVVNSHDSTSRCLPGF